MGTCVVLFFGLSPWETSGTIAHNHLIQLIMFGSYVGFFASITGLGMWIVACVISFTGKQVKRDYRQDKLFE